MGSLWKGPLLESRDPDGPRYERAPRGWVTLLILLAAIGGTAAFFFGEARERRFFDALESTGRPATGRVTKLTEYRRRTTRTIAHYDYTVGGRRYEGNKEVSRTRFAGLHVGDPVAVTFLPSDPARSIILPVRQARQEAADEYARAVVVCVVFWVGVASFVYTRMRNSDFAFGSVRHWHK